MAEGVPKPWLLWAYDPCPEGGWSIRGEFDTKDQAIEAAKFLHAKENRHHQEMVEFCKDSPMPWSSSSGCYDGCMVTPNAVFRLNGREAHESKDR